MDTPATPAHAISGPSNQKTDARYQNHLHGHQLEQNPVHHVTGGARQARHQDLQVQGSVQGCRQCYWDEECSGKWMGIQAHCFLQNRSTLRMKKIGNLISEYVHKRSVLLLIKNKADNMDFEGLQQMRFYCDHKQTDVLRQLSIHMANAKVQYGFEYLGVHENLVQTPLPDHVPGSGGQTWRFSI